MKGIAVALAVFTALGGWAAWRIWESATWERREREAACARYRGTARWEQCLKPEEPD